MTIQSRPIFQLERPYAPPGIARPPVLSVVGTKIPTFTVNPDATPASIWGSLRTILTPVKLSKDGPRGVLHYARAARLYFRGRSLSASFIIHCGLILAILYLPLLITPEATIPPEELVVPEKIYYLPVPKQAKELPKIAPDGLGGRPMSGAVPGLPVQGSTASHSVLTIVSRMDHPENAHQTIVQPDTPPELRIKSDVKLPNMLLGKPLDAPKAPLQFNATAAKPVQTQRKTSDDQAPSPEAENSANPLMKLVTTPTLHPLLSTSAASGVAAARTNTSSGASAAPSVSESGNPGDSNVLALVVDPSDSSRIAMPAGNRSGEFSVSASPVPGSPGGTASGVPAAGEGNHGAGGDLSVGVGRSSSGGGGKGSVSVSTSVGGPQGTLEAELALKGVYPVPPTFKLRRNTLVISAGPTGGGGLDVYGALHNCGRISTIFLPMPSKNWTMQFCQQNAPAAPEVSQEPATVIHMQEGMVPPQADTQFDFRRSPVPDANKKQIILKGTLRADGTVDDVQIYQSALPEMDEAARTAFSHWKFKPAMRAGKAIPVQILVGIPVDAQPPARP